MKRRCSVLILTLLFALTACGPAPQTDDRITLTIMGKEHDLNNTYIHRILDLYEKDGAYKIQLIRVPSDGDADFNAALEKAFAEGNGPDILFHFNDSTLTGYLEKEQFLYLDDEAWVSDLMDGAAAYCRDSKGRLLGLPFWENSISGCYYNKTLFDSLGLRPASTQMEFDTLCQALKSVGYTPLCWSFTRCHWNYQFALDPVFADDPALLERLNAGEISYADIPELRDMLEWLAAADQKGWFGENYADRDWDGISDVMTSGECAMINIWDTWFDTNMGTDGKYTKEDFALMPIFLNTEPNGTYEGGNLNMMMVNRESEHVEEALEFLRFCADRENYNRAFDGISTVSCFKGQTTNIQSPMVTDAMASINLHGRASTANPKIIGYAQQEMGGAVHKLIMGEVDVDDCITLMDESRIAAAKALGAPGF